MAFSDIAAKAVQGFAGAAGNTQAQAQVGDWQKNRADQQQNQVQLQIAPLTQAIQADRQKLTAFIDDSGNVIPEHQKDYDATVKNMSDMIGRMRGLLGQKQPGDDPNHFESTVAGLTDKLHITRDLAHRLKTGQQAKVAQYQGKNQQMAQDTAAGVLPYGMTPEGQSEAAKTADAIKVADARRKSTYENFKGPNDEVLTIDTATQTPPPGYIKIGTVENSDAKKRKDFEDFKSSHPDYKGNYEEWLKNPSGAPKPGSPEWLATMPPDKMTTFLKNKRALAIATQPYGAQNAAVNQGRLGVSQEMAQIAEDRLLYGTETADVSDLEKKADALESSAQIAEARAADPTHPPIADTGLVIEWAKTQIAGAGRLNNTELEQAIKSGSMGTRVKNAFDKATSGNLDGDFRKQMVGDIRLSANVAKKISKSASEQHLSNLQGGLTPEGPKTKQLRSQKKLTAKDLEDALQ